MAGLLDQLESLLGSSGLNAKISVQVDGLNGVTGAVQKLIAGPQSFANLKTAIGNAPVPPGLDGLASMGQRLGSLSVPTDLSGPIAPLLTPLAGLVAEVAGGGAAQAMAAFDLVRETIHAATGQDLGGPSGMPDEGGFRMPDMPAIDQFRGHLASASHALDLVGPKVDAAALLELLKAASSGFRKAELMLPHIPVIDDIMEPLGTVAAWQTMSGQEIGANFARTLERTAELIAAPRRDVAAPVIDAAASIAAGKNDLAALLVDLTPVCASVRDKILTGRGQATTLEVLAIERAADLAGRLAQATHPATSPLIDCDLVDERITRSLLAVIRALEPAYTLSSIALSLRAKIAGIAPPPEGALDTIVKAITDFDISVLTDPLKTVTGKVRQAVDEVNAAKESVRKALEDALSPVEKALDDALQAAGFDQIREALESLPAQVQKFVDDEIKPNLEPIQADVSNAVDTVTAAAAKFKPADLLAPIQSAVNDAAALLNNDTVRGTFAELQQTLDAAIAAISQIDLGGAGDESVKLIGGIEVKVSAIDPSMIPDAAKPALKQAVKAVTDIDFTGEVGKPVLTKLEGAIEQGPVALLGAIEESMDALRSRLDAFRPSQVVGVALDKPFQDLTDALDKFKPSDLLAELQKSLDELAGKLKVLDVGAVVDPLVELHTSIKAKVDALKPSKLLEPVDQAIQSAIEKVYEASGVDTVFKGIHDVLNLVQSWTGLLADARDLLNRAGAMLEQPGDASASVAQMVDGAVAKLDAVDIGRLQAGFAAAAAAVRSIDRDTVARDLALAFQNAGQSGPALLASAEIESLKRLARAFPLAEMCAQRETPSRERLEAAVRKWQSGADALDASRQPWSQVAPRLNEAAGAIQERLLDYYRVSQLEAATVFADFLNPPQTAAALKECVRAELSSALTDPLTTVMLGLQALAPYVRFMAQGIASVLGAFHDKIDALTGSDGIGGTVNAIEDAVNLLKGIDLKPLTGPLDEIYGRIGTVLDSLDPTPLRTTLEAARDAVANLLSIATLIKQGDIDKLNQAYTDAVGGIGALAPSAIISQTLDPVYERILADFLPVLDLPKQLREKVDAAGKSLRDEAVVELARVEEAFDHMLKSIPLDGGGGGVGVSVTASASIG